MNHETSHWTQELNDLDRRPAIIVSVPRDPSKPTLDSLDADVYSKRLQEVVDSVIEEYEESNLRAARISHYQISSAAEWSGTLAVVFDHAPAVLSIGANLIAYAQAAIAIANRVRESNLPQLSYDQAGQDPVMFDLSNPIVDFPVVAGLVAKHYEEHYGDIEEASVKWHARIRSALGGSIAHPVGGEVYTVNVRNGKESFVYIVTAEGQALEHFFATKRTIVPLQLPNWLNLDPFDFPQTWSSGWATIEQD